MKKDILHELRIASLYLGGRELDVLEWMKDPVHNHVGLPKRLESIREAIKLIGELISGKYE